MTRARSGPPLDLNLMSDKITLPKIDEDDIVPASQQLLRMAKRSGRKFPITELQDLFDMLDLDIAVLPRRADDAV